MKLRSPVLLLIFNRPALAANILDQVRGARPPRLYIAADGPRETQKGEAEACARARTIAERVDWPCEVKTLFRKRNLGCGLAVSLAVSWFFQHEPEGVVLEDDLALHPDFFPFCDAMLEKYRAAERVMSITGSNFQYGLQRGGGRYYFSCLPHAWGWASWARAWKNYDPALKPQMHELRTQILPKLFRHKKIHRYFCNAFYKTATGELDSWAYRWLHAHWREDALCIKPNANLVSNIGFKSGSTHTGAHASVFSNAERWNWRESIEHPPEIARDSDADDWEGLLLSSPESTQLNMLQEAARRVASGEAVAALGLTRALYNAYGNFPALMQWEAVVALHRGAYDTALHSAMNLLEARPSSPQARQLADIATALFSGRKPAELPAISFSDDMSPGECVRDKKAATQCALIVERMAKDKTPLRLELGQRRARLPGWVTLDMAGAPDVRVDLLRDGIPFPDNSVDAIYSSHLFEHFSYPRPMRRILEECRRVLKGEAKFSICVPDAKLYVAAYLNGANNFFQKKALFGPAWIISSPIDYINYIAYMDGYHKHLFDLDNLLTILSHAGFVNIRARDFDPAIDLEVHRWESIYAEAQA